MFFLNILELMRKYQHRHQSFSWHSPLVVVSSSKYQIKKNVMKKMIKVFGQLLKQFKYAIEVGKNDD